MSVMDDGKEMGGRQALLCGEELRRVDAILSKAASDAGLVEADGPELLEVLEQLIRGSRSGPDRSAAHSELLGVLDAAAPFLLAQARAAARMRKLLPALTQTDCPACGLGLRRESMPRGHDCGDPWHDAPGRAAAELKT